MTANREHRHLLMVVLAPLVPQILGSAFNIWYNTVIIHPMLATAELQRRFLVTVLIYNVIVFPIGMYLWIKRVYSFAQPLHQLGSGGTTERERLAIIRRRVIHLPWYAAAISGIAWFMCIPVFIVSLWQVQSLPPHLLWHLPISFCISGFISVTHTIFAVELASHRRLFPVFFSGVRPDLMPDVVTLTLRGRGLLWAVSASLCPIGSLLLLAFAPHSPGMSSAWFAAFVGTVGIAFALVTALLISRLVAGPIDQLRSAAESVSRGKLDVTVPVARADEFGLLLGEFNNMIRGLKEKEKLRQTFGLHVGERAAQEILKRDPGLSGVEEHISVMFVDMRSSTAQAAAMKPAEVVEMLNDFLRVTVSVVEAHGGMVNKYLGDGFMALFGAGETGTKHADAAVSAGRDIFIGLEALNAEFVRRGRKPLHIGVGIHTGPAIVGSIGSPQRLEFTAMGNTVNVASRVEGLCKVVMRDFLITEDVYVCLTKEFPLEPLPAQPVKGIDEPVKIYTWRME